MAKYLLASDFDGTFIHWPGGKVDEKDREAVKRFREAGNVFAIVTGRSYWNAIAGFDFSDFHDMDCFLCMSGAYCAYPDEKVVYDKRVTTKRLPEIIDFFKSVNGRYLSMDIGTKSYSIDIGRETPLESVISAEEAVAFPDFTSLNAGFRSEEEAVAVVKGIKERFSDTITPLQNINCIDMPPVGMNKALGCKNAAEIFGVPEDNIYTVGDSYNDKDMIAAFHGNAMDTGLKSLADVAEYSVHRIHEIIDRIMAQ